MKIVLCVLVLVFFLIGSNGMINEMKIYRDDRSHFLIETFGFNKGGRMEFNVSNFIVRKIIFKIINLFFLLEKNKFIQIKNVISFAFKKESFEKKEHLKNYSPQK